MRFRPLQHQVYAAFLGLCFLASWTLKTSHALLVHYEHHAVPVCAAGHEHQATHLHDERYNPDDCSICAFVLAAPELPTLILLPLPPAPLALRSVTPASVAVCPAGRSSIFLRGPPALA